MRVPPLCRPYAPLMPIARQRPILPQWQPFLRWSNNMTSSNSFAGQLADAITNTDRMQAEARELLGFAPDVALLPAEALRVQVVMALRTVIFDQLDGKGVDPA